MSVYTGLHSNEIFLLQTGRGVPVIIPPDAVQSLEFLTSAEVRTQAGIPEDNKYVFGNQGN